MFDHDSNKNKLIEAVKRFNETFNELDFEEQKRTRSLIDQPVMLDKDDPANQLLAEVSNAMVEVFRYTPIPNGGLFLSNTVLYTILKMEPKLPNSFSYTKDSHKPKRYLCCNTQRGVVEVQIAIDK
ncbi:hypothetical protein [Endozoicomonas sp. ONNA1]|uniref:hypothetical protein n=1 Tax=Endozoicomonas sp. ONNA1 TaxID=2828740 RepID=UPI002149863F|nr:hypothetical protein [Endozoicomonas sp. ONNA1]